MARHLIFKCPSSGLNVQCRIEPAGDNEGDDDRDDFEEIECPACGSSHFINRQSGKVLGER